MAKNIVHFTLLCEKTEAIQVVVAERLRRWTRNPLGSPRAGSNPADNEKALVRCYYCETMDHL